MGKRNHPVHAKILEKLMLSYPLQEFFKWNGNPRSRVMKLRMRVHMTVSIVLLTVMCMPSGARGGDIDHTRWCQ